jgi:hypothetical protein
LGQSTVTQQTQDVCNVCYWPKAEVRHGLVY